jgi:hypothetical protein
MPLSGGGSYIQHGMTLRDYFAGQALPSVILACVNDTVMPGENMTRMFARKSYEMADAMIAARTPLTSDEVK